MKSKINSVELILMRIDFCDLRIYIIIRMESWDNILFLHEINIENPWIVLFLPTDFYYITFCVRPFGSLPTEFVNTILLASFTL